MSNISTFGTFGTARLGIYASQKALEVVGNNISNINTPGYTRQKLDQVSLYNKGSDRYVTAYGVLVAILCNMGIATPGGSGFVALAQKDGYITGGETMKFSLLLIAMMYVTVMLIFWPVARFLF